MPSHPFEQTPPQLAGFPEPVCAAYARFQHSHDPDAALEVILRAMKNFLPESSPIGTDATLDNSMRLVEDLGYDSLAVAEVVFFIEDLFRVRLEKKDIEAVRTVGDLKNAVSHKLSQHHPSA